MKPQDPDYLQRVRTIFSSAGFMTFLGVEPVLLEPGRVHTAMRVGERHLQQDGFIHAGVQAAMADHTAGAAATSLIGSDEIVLSVEFKINLLRPAQGEDLECEAVVLKAGRKLTVAEAEVFSVSPGKTRKMVSKATITLAVLDTSEFQPSRSARA